LKAGVADEELEEGGIKLSPNLKTGGLLDAVVLGTIVLLLLLRAVGVVVAVA
jgi:hypothetical protein